MTVVVPVWMIFAAVYALVSGLLFVSANRDSGYAAGMAQVMVWLVMTLCCGSALFVYLIMRH